MTVTMEKEHLTEDLLKRLLASSSVESYLDTHETVNTTLTEFLRELTDARRLKRSEVARESGLNPTVGVRHFRRQEQARTRPRYHAGARHRLHAPRNAAPPKTR